APELPVRATSLSHEAFTAGRCAGAGLGTRQVQRPAVLGTTDEVAELGSDGGEEALEGGLSLLDLAQRRLPERRHVRLGSDGWERSDERSRRRCRVDLAFLLLDVPAVEEALNDGRLC